MKRYFIFVLPVIFTCAIILSACSKSKEDDGKLCNSLGVAPVTKVEGPVTVAVNQNIALSVYFTCFNGCGNFGNYESSASGNTTTVKVIAKYQGCVCTQDMPTRQSTYNFNAAQPGVYDIKFLQQNNVYLTHTITVQ